MLTQIGHDLRFALRTLRKNPGFTAVVVTSLALGVGANTAIFSVINAVMLKSLPVDHAEQLYLVKHEARTASAQRFSVPLFEHLRAALPAGSSIAGISRVSRMYGVLQPGHAIETTAVQLVTGEFFPLIGRAPLMGRTLTPDDNRTVGGHPVAVVSEGCWRRAYGASPDVLGRDVVFNGAHFTIVGVGPAGFTGVLLETPVDFWVPVMMQSDVHYAQNYSSSNSNDQKPWATQLGIRWLDLMVRTSSTAPLASAMNVAFQQMVEAEAATLHDPAFRETFRQQSLSLVPFHRGFSRLRDRFEQPLYTLLGMVGMILLIACANTANLMLSRASSRRREIAVRLSMGATRPRLIRQLLTESVLLVCVAAALGLLLARWSGDILVRMTLGVTTGATPLSLPLDGRVLSFTMLLSFATVLLFGLAPAFRATDLDLNDALKQSGRSIQGGSRFTAAKLLVAGQVALSMLLVAGSLLFVRSLQNLSTMDLGFSREHLLAVILDPDAIALSDERVAMLNRALQERVENIPGVQSASLAFSGLAAGFHSSSDGLQFTGYQSRPDEQMRMMGNRVTLNYFATVGMRLMAGRDFNAGDTDKSPKVAIINQAAARRYFAGRSPLGERFGGGTPDTLIVGVVADARTASVQEEPEPMAFYPMAQKPARASSLDVRAAGDPKTLAADVRTAIAQVAPDLPIVRVRTMTEQVDSNLVQERLLARLTTVFGGLALGLACFGLYGVMSYAVSRRTSELGVRMALGATPAGVLAMVFRESLGLVLAGLAVGLPLVILAGRQLSKILFRVNTSDPKTLAIAAVSLLAAAALAGYLPAWRASRVDPLVALRNE